MFLKAKISFVAAVLALGFVMTGCTDDQKKPEETVAPAATEEPATPPMDSSKFASEAVLFALDDYSLNAEGQTKLNGLADFLKSSPKVAIQIEGHCDERGSVEYNLALGERRANAVKDYLVQLGVEAARLSTISYGEERPAAEGHDEAAWSKNRRAQFVLSQQ